MTKSFILKYIFAGALNPHALLNVDATPLATLPGEVMIAGYDGAQTGAAANCATGTSTGATPYFTSKSCDVITGLGTNVNELFCYGDILQRVEYNSTSTCQGSEIISVTNGTIDVILDFEPMRGYVTKFKFGKTCAETIIPEPDGRNMTLYLTYNCSVNPAQDTSSSTSGTETGGETTSGTETGGETTSGTETGGKTSGATTMSTLVASAGLILLWTLV